MTANLTAKKEERLYRWKVVRRPYSDISDSDLENFSRELMELKVGKKLTEVPSGLYVYGTTGSFSGGWLGSSNIKSVKKIDSEYFLFEAEGGAIWRTTIAGYNRPDEVGCSSRTSFTSYSISTVER